MYYSKVLHITKPLGCDVMGKNIKSSSFTSSFKAHTKKLAMTISYPINLDIISYLNIQVKTAESRA